MRANNKEEQQMGQLQGVDLTPEIEGRYHQTKMQWICIHADFREKESGREWQLYWWPSIAAHDEGLVMALYQGDRVINLSKFHDPFGTIEWDGREANLTYPDYTSLSGSFPHYDVELDATDNHGTRYGLDIHMEAESKAFEAVRDLKGIDWYYVPRFKVEGKLRTWEGEFEVEGNGYMEKRRGRFWAPGTRNGLWESLPMQSKQGLAVPLFYKVWKNDGSPTLQTLCYTLDGQTLYDLENIDVEILETISYEGQIDHPVKFRVTAEGEGASAKLDVVRNPNRLALRDFWGEPDESRRAVGIYGTGYTEAVVEDATGKHETAGPSFGSALYFWVS
jgi:hypothetical protein